jgi:hypothetical protein
MCFSQPNPALSTEKRNFYVTATPTIITAVLPIITLPAVIKPQHNIAVVPAQVSSLLVSNVPIIIP